jgi:hypothetical protein
VWFISWNSRAFFLPFIFLFSQLTLYHFIWFPGNGKTSTGRTITHLNFAIPLEAMTDAVNTYLVEEDRKYLEVLNSPSTRVDDIWSLRGSAPVWEPLEKGECDTSLPESYPQRRHLELTILKIHYLIFSCEQALVGLPISRIG